MSDGYLRVESQPLPSERPRWRLEPARRRILVEDEDVLSRWSIAQMVKELGYEVIACDGPDAEEGRLCALLETGWCPLVELADAVVCGLRLREPCNREILEGIERAGKPVILQVAADKVAEWTRPGRMVLSYPLTHKKLGNALAQIMHPASRPHPSRA